MAALRYFNGSQPDAVVSNQPRRPAPMPGPNPQPVSPPTQSSSTPDRGSEQISVSGACSHFGEVLPDSIITFESDEEAEDVIERIVDASGLTQNFRVRAAGVPNAAAVIEQEKRYILYSQYFMRDTRRRANSPWAAISIMAHEVGHHLNGHTLERGGSRPPIELEADYFSGYVTQRMGADLDEARLAMSLLASETGSTTHPAKHDRLAAITNGWTRACSRDSECDKQEPGPPRPEPEPVPKPQPKPEPEPPHDPTNSCRYAHDGECDEADLCDPGTDTADCGATPRTPLYCCDQFGRKWCPIIASPGPVGTMCMCVGVPGTGVICT